ncbi:hypothetical protein [Brevundimonas sp.]|jgi:hypothetical protein|uniref:hypothetical protein n=1 Tax=Brevundimonas sp. TaxID=1871086 RepID=UPI0025BCAAFE|nr:hypothetical protein [Brevundimonas sp.]
MTFLACLALTLSPTGHAEAATIQESTQAGALSDVARCRTIVADADRLACFDRAVSALDAAERAGEVVVLDRAQVRETNRQLFGFEIVNPFVGRTNIPPEPVLEAIETTLASANPSGDGKWVFRLANGSEWRQIDSGPVRFRNREGEAVRVRRASLGSYMMTLGNSRAVRVRRH